MLCALGNLGIVFGEAADPPRPVRERGRWRYLTFSEAAVNSRLPEVVETIEQTVQRLGGPA